MAQRDDEGMNPAFKLLANRSSTFSAVHRTIDFDLTNFCHVHRACLNTQAVSYRGREFPLSFACGGTGKVRGANSSK